MLTTEKGTAVGGKQHADQLDPFKTFVLGLAQNIRILTFYICSGRKLTPVPKALLVALLEDPPLLLCGDVLHAHWGLHINKNNIRLWHNSIQFQ